MSKSKTINKNNNETDIKLNKVKLKNQVDELKIIKSENKKLKNIIKNMQQNAENASEKLLRAHAEMDNIRKRTQKEIKNIHKFSLEKFTIALLPILDSLHKTIEITKKTKENKSIIQGISLTMKIFLDTLEKFNIKKIDPIGKTFDPNLHEAMAMQSNAKMKNNDIIEILQCGYKMNNRVIRPARVIVVKNNNN